MLCLPSITVSAQHWNRYKTEADELKGTSASSRHYIKLSGKGMVIINDNEDLLSFYSSTGSFDYKSFEGEKVILGKFGMYDTTGKLVEKVDIMMAIVDEVNSIAIADGHYTSIDKSGLSTVLSWLRSKRGSLRVIIPRYNEPDFDVTVPTLLSQTTQKRGQAKSKGVHRK